MKSLVLPFILLLTAFAAAQAPAAVESEILSRLDTIDKYSTYLGEFDQDKSDAANKALRETLVRYGKRLDILQYAFPKLKDKMFVSTSPDGKLRIYSWDEGTGGTMHDFTSVYQFQGASGAVNTWSGNGDDESGGGYYTQIFQEAAKSGTFYLATAVSIAQGNLHGQSIEAIRINGDTLDTKAKLIRTGSGPTNVVYFSYDPSSLNDRSEDLISFDPAKQEFRFPVVVEDKDFGNGRVTSRYITYRFNGQYFVKVT
jgi:hypothetical protein